MVEERRGSYCRLDSLASKRVKSCSTARKVKNVMDALDRAGNLIKVIWYSILQAGTASSNCVPRYSLAPRSLSY